MPLRNKGTVLLSTVLLGAILMGSSLARADPTWFVPPPSVTAPGLRLNAPKLAPLPASPDKIEHITVTATRRFVPAPSFRAIILPTDRATDPELSAADNPAAGGDYHKIMPCCSSAYENDLGGQPGKP